MTVDYNLLTTPLNKNLWQWLIGWGCSSRRGWMDAPRTTATGLITIYIQATPKLSRRRIRYNIISIYIESKRWVADRERPGVGQRDDDGPRRRIRRDGSDWRAYTKRTYNTYARRRPTRHRTRLRSRYGYVLWRTNERTTLKKQRSSVSSYAYRATSVGNRWIVWSEPSK